MAACGLQEDFEEVASIPLASMTYNVAGQTFVVLARPEGTLATGKLLNTLRFTVKEIDPSTGACCSTLTLHSLTLLPAWTCWALLCCLHEALRRQERAGSQWLTRLPGCFGCSTCCWRHGTGAV